MGLTWFHHCRFRYNSLTSKQIRWLDEIILWFLLVYQITYAITDRPPYLTAANKNVPPILCGVLVCFPPPLLFFFFLNISNTYTIVLDVWRSPYRGDFSHSSMWHVTEQFASISESNCNFPLHTIYWSAKCLVLVSHHPYCTNASRLTAKYLHHGRTVHCRSLEKMRN